ncbi:MAG: methylated-DNA--[protein]-cysteine S-methyltransferase [Bacteroidota bacterium]
METQSIVNFQRIEEAIGYIRNNFQQQPTLDEVAEHVNLSPYHFQRMFTDWAGVSPKKFLQYISTTYAKKLLKDEQATLFEASYETGLSGTSRLHDLFMKIEGMTPAEYKNGGKDLFINYSFADTPFGEIIVASTQKGICHLAFSANKEQALNGLKNQYPNATFDQHLDRIQQNALFIFTHDWNKLDEIKLHLKGTDFQLKVWETLIKIPSGGLSTYGRVAQQINHPKASRAVGSAVGDNPIAYLIPCHRVIQSSGQIGEYHWGSNRKTAIIGWEAAQASY